MTVCLIRIDNKYKDENTVAVSGMVAPFVYGKH